MATTQDRWVNKVLGGTRYVVSEKLGEGGMGAVYLAEDRKLKTWVVIKTPHPSMLRDPEFVARFKLEVQSLVTLSHPHIVKVIDVDQHGDVPFVVLQYLPGGSLESRLYPAASLVPQPQSVFQVFMWLTQMASALDFMHSRGYVHRDIKPANILFDEAEHAYLTDFGIAKVLGEVEAQPTQRLTATGMILGTAEYMAPELLQGKPFDHRVDQYALAVTVFEALSGTRPYDGNTPAALALAQVQRPVPNLHERVAEMPVELSRALTRALSLSPEDRFPSCSEFAAALRGSNPLVPHGSQPSSALVDPQSVTSAERLLIDRRSTVLWRSLIAMCLLLLSGALAWTAKSFLFSTPVDTKSFGKLAGSKMDNLPSDSTSSDQNGPLSDVRPLESPASQPQPTLKLAPFKNVLEIREGERWILKANAIPVGLGLKGLRFALGADSPTGCRIDEETGVISWTPTEVQGPGRYTLSVVVSSRDAPLLKDEQSFEISVLEVNQPPSINPIANQSVDEDNVFQLAVKALDPDQPPSALRFALQTNPSIDAHINPTTGLIDWMPQAENLGNEFHFHVDVSESDNPQSISSREFKVRFQRLPRHDVLLVQNPDRIKWDAQTNMTGQELQRRIDQEKKDLAWRPTCLSGYRRDDGSYGYASVWVSDSSRVTWTAHYNLGVVERQSVYDKMPDTSSVIWHSFNQDRSQVIVAAVANKTPRVWGARDDFTRQRLETELEKSLKSGYRPVAIWQEGPDKYGAHVVGDGYGATYGAGYPENVLRTKLSNLPTGHRPIWIDGFGQDQGRRYSFVSIRDVNKPKWDLQPGLKLGLKPKEFDQAMILAKQQGLIPLVIDVE